MFWRPCVLVGRCVSVSALCVCSLRGWVGHRVLSVTPQSRLLTLDLPNLQPGTAASADETETEQSIGLSLQESFTDTQMLLSNVQTSGAEEQQTDTTTQRVEALRGASADAHTACAVKVKRSKVISYKVRRDT